MTRKQLQSRSVVIGAVALLLAATSLYGQGYQIRGGEVVVDSRDHWDHWQVPTHLVSVEPEGSVRANNFRLVYNLLDDLDYTRTLEIVDRGPRVMNIDSTLRINIDGNPATDSQSNLVYDYQLSPGVSRVGSNPQLASNIIDNDPNTFWEPDPDDPIDTWWVEIDLARAVPVERLRLQFVDEELGDPFLRFVLFLEQKQLPLLEDETKFNFFTFIPFKGINRDRRLFVIESERTSGLLPPVEEGLLEETLRMGNAGPAWTGRMIETIRIQITDTRGSRAEQITEEEWNDLPVSERGDIAYFVRDVAGREEPVDADTYASLDESRQGRRDFYRRELPRLAEVDVWGWGDNVALGLLSAGGSIENTLGLGSPENAFDGELSTFYRHTYFNEALPNDKLVHTNLGGTVWLEQVRVISEGTRYHQAPTVRGYILRVSSGVRDAENRIKYEQISDEDKEKNADAGLFQLLNNVVSPPRRARFFEFLTLKNKPQGSTTTVGRAPGIGEFLIFSEGPPAEAILVSDIIELPRRVDLGAISWEAVTPPGTRVEIRTRTGDQLRRRIRYFDKAGGEKNTFSEWNRLLFFAKGPVDTSFVPGSGWSPWSQRYEASGDRVTSPPLRRYLQIEARLIADNLAEPPALNRITVAFHDPVVQELAAEVWPRDALVGVLDTFTIVIKTLMVEEPVSDASPGFDEILVRSEPVLDMELIDVEVGTEVELRDGEPFRRYDLRQGATLSSVDGAALEIIQDGGDSLQIRFPSTIDIAPQELASRDYYRALSEGDEVPTRTDGTLLTATTYESLPEDQKGSIQYFRQEEDGSLTRVSQSAWQGLEPAQRGPVRYFRIVGDVAEQSRLDDSGVPLTQDTYAQLPPREQGQVVGPSRLIQLRMAATVFLHGTELNVSARGGGPGVPWQAGNAADVTELTPGNGLVLSALGSKLVLSDMRVAPNPFSPNGDDINDQAEISLSVFRVFDLRPLTVSIYTLGGRRVRVLEKSVAGGRHVFRWDGRDEHTDLVPPGLYLVQAEAHLDETSVKGRRSTRVVAVVY